VNSVEKTQISVVLLLFLAFLPVVAYSQSGSDQDQKSLHVRDMPDLRVEKNTNLTISPKVVGGELGKLPIRFSVEEGPSHGVVDQSNGAMLTYMPNDNYTGPDDFAFKAIAINKTSDMTNSSNIGKASLTVNPSSTSQLVFVGTPEQRAGLAFGISLIIVLLIFVVAYIVIRKIRMRQTKKIKPRFWDIIRDDNWYPSLAIFQFLLWTGIVLFAYFGISLTRLFSGVGVIPDIPSTLLIVMGISAAVPVVGAVVSNFQYAGTTPPGVVPTKEVPSDQIRKKLPGFKTMLMENDKITLPRFQMFAWTWIGIIAYLGLLFVEVNTKMGYFESLLIPSLPILLVSLMGLSQVTYLTAKSVKPSFFSINEVRPNKLRLQKENNLITVLGSNFGQGNKGTVWIEYYPPVTEDEKNENSPLTAKEKQRMDDKEIKEYEKEWTNDYIYSSFRLQYQVNATQKMPREDHRIVVTLDNIKDKLKPQKYVVRVEKDGLLTYANSDAAFELTFTTATELYPADRATGIPIHSSITAKFSMPMQSSTFTNSSFILRDSNRNEVPGTVSSDGKIATFNPTNNLSYNTQYTVTIANDVSDEDGFTIPFDITWSFKTENSFPSVTPTTSVTPTPTTSVTPTPTTSVTPTPTTSVTPTPTTSVTPTPTASLLKTNKPIDKLKKKMRGDDNIRLGAGIIFFNDYSSLKRCINSINEGVDIIFAIDGKFPTFPGDSQFSTDGSRELVNSYSKCLLVDCPKSEFEKREKYLEYCALYTIDILLIIDSDEFVLNCCDWETIRRDLKTAIFDRDKCEYNVYAVMLQCLENSQDFAPYPRLWYDPLQMEYYAGRHYCFRNKDLNKNNIPNQPDFVSRVIEGIVLGHDHSLRSKYHLEGRSMYQTWLVNFERSLSK
jgi:hypothetical protein